MVRKTSSFHFIIALPPQLQILHGIHISCLRLQTKAAFHCETQPSSALSVKTVQPSWTALILHKMSLVEHKCLSNSSSAFFSRRLEFLSTATQPWHSGRWSVATWHATARSHRGQGHGRFKGIDVGDFLQVTLKLENKKSNFSTVEAYKHWSLLRTNLTKTRLDPNHQFPH